MEFKILDFFETDVNNKTVYILHVNIDIDLYLVKLNNYKVLTCNKRNNECVLEFSKDSKEEVLEEIYNFVRKNGYETFYNKYSIWKESSLSYKQKELANKLNLECETSGDFNKYLSKLKCKKVLKDVI